MSSSTWGFPLFTVRPNNEHVRRREARWLFGGWCCVVAAWSIAASSQDVGVLGSDSEAQPPISIDSESSDDLLQLFYSQLQEDDSRTGEEAVQRVSRWTGATEQRERLLVGGKRKLKEASGRGGNEWEARQQNLRMGAEAIVVGGWSVPGELEFAADALVASGDLLKHNGRDALARRRYERSLVVYDRILTLVGIGELRDRTERKRLEVTRDL